MKFLTYSELSRETLLEFLASRTNEATGIKVGVALEQALFDNDNLELRPFKLVGIDGPFEMNCIKGTNTFVDLRLGWDPWRCELPEDISVN
jgi:hypothetical protein